MQQKVDKLRGFAVNFTALLFEKSAHTLDLIADMIRGEKKLSVKIEETKKGGESNE